MVEEYSVKLTKQAIKDKDKEKIKQYPALKTNVENLVNLIKKKPFETPPPCEALVGNYKGL